MNTIRAESNWHNWAIPPVGDPEGCHGDSHVFPSPARDGDWHELTCSCGITFIQAIAPLGEAYIDFLAPWTVK